MKSPNVADLQPNQIVTATFLVLGKEVRQKKTGEPYLSLSLGDRSGDIDAKMWDNVSDIVETFEKDNFVKVKGVAQVYQNKLQFTIHKLMRLAVPWALLLTAACAAALGNGLVWNVG